MWKSINSLRGEAGGEKGVLPCMKSKDLLRVVLTLTCNSFTTVVHIVRGVTPSDCGAQIRHMVYDCQYKPREKDPCVLTRPRLVAAKASRMFV